MRKRWIALQVDAKPLDRSSWTQHHRDLEVWIQTAAPALHNRPRQALDKKRSIVSCGALTPELSGGGRHAQHTTATDPQPFA